MISAKHFTAGLVKEYIVKVHKKGLMVPRCSLKELYGIAREHVDVLEEMIKELQEERRREACF